MGWATVDGHDVIQTPLAPDWGLATTRMAFLPVTTLATL
jgi:hypothetical protein